MESAPDTTPADELIKEVRKAMQSTGDRVQEISGNLLQGVPAKIQAAYRRGKNDPEKVVQKIAAD